MATIEFYDPEAACFRKVRFSGEQPQHVTQALDRARRFQVLEAQGIPREQATAQLDAEDELDRLEEL